MGLNEIDVDGGIFVDFIAGRKSVWNAIKQVKAQPKQPK